MLPDNQIVEGCRKGESKAFRALYDKYASVLLGICFRYTGSKQEAEDVMQEGFVKVFNKIDTYKGSGSFEGWLKRIMVNMAINHFKLERRKRSRNIDMKIEQIGEEHSEQFDQDLEMDEVLSHEELMKLVQALPDGYRLVFNMYVIEGYSHDQIAKELEVSVNTSKTQLFKARRQLKEKVEEKRQELMEIR